MSYHVVAEGDRGTRAIDARVGQEVDVELGNVGAAIYQSPPTISSPVVTYLGVGVVPPYTPAGPNQRFRVVAVSVGVAVIHFQRALGDSVVATADDTVRVQ